LVQEPLIAFFIKNLSYDFGKTKALSDVNLSISSQGFVELFILNQMSVPFGNLIPDDQPVVIEYHHVLVF
jgi:hypothetical protein